MFLNPLDPYFKGTFKDEREELLPPTPKTVQLDIDAVGKIKQVSINSEAYLMTMIDEATSVLQKSNGLVKPNPKRKKTTTNKL